MVIAGEGSFSAKAGKKKKGVALGEKGIV